MRMPTANTRRGKKTETQSDHVRLRFFLRGDTAENGLWFTTMGQAALPKVGEF